MTPIDTSIIQLLAPFIAGVAGVAAGYTGLKARVKSNTRDIIELKKQWTLLQGNPGHYPAYIRREECESRKTHVSEELAEVTVKLEQQAKATLGLQNFARWLLTNKENLTLIEAERIINGE